MPGHQHDTFSVRQCATVSRHSKYDSTASPGSREFSELQRDDEMLTDMCAGQNCPCKIRHQVCLLDACLQGEGIRDETLHAIQGEIGKSLEMQSTYFRFCND